MLKRVGLKLHVAHSAALRKEICVFIASESAINDTAEELYLYILSFCLLYHQHHRPFGFGGYVPLSLSLSLYLSLSFSACLSLPQGVSTRDGEVEGGFSSPLSGPPPGLGLAEVELCGASGRQSTRRPDSRQGKTIPLADIL
jgi:hypothetical protein